jgi:hypothetical protein
MQCHYPPVWATCFEPQLIPVVTGKPKYNKDGSLKKAGKAGTQEVKFTFR